MLDSRLWCRCMPAVSNFKSHLSELFAQALHQVAPDALSAEILIERPKQAAHGDYACNLAMQLAKPLRKSPRDIAQALIAALPASEVIDKVEIAGAGFINIFITATAKQTVVNTVLQATQNYGHVTIGSGRTVQVEFVSANPTGPLHVGHGRGAAYGASLANVLEAAGYKVTREYYVNDAGRQIDILALSTWLRYLQLHGEQLNFPGNAYQGDYVRDMAQQIRTTQGDKFLHPVAAAFAQVPDFAEYPDAHLDTLIANAKRLLQEDYSYIHHHALNEQLNDCREDLQAFGVYMDVWFSEQSLFDTGAVAKVVETLKRSNHLFQQDGAWWFRSTEFGDEKDRVVQRDNGLYTYFASDIAYHLCKFERGFDRIINVWGADHHGYIQRINGALKAMGQDNDKLTIVLVQFAVLYRNGEKAAMSTRSGEFVTLRDLRAEVGNDATRFFYVMRKSDQHLDFDLDLAKSQSNENPVYYIQYAHARIHSVLTQWDGERASLMGADFKLLNSEYEVILLQRLIDYPHIIENAAQDLAPHSIAFYLKNLAADLHSYYNASRFLVEDEAVKLARLALICATAQVMRNGLSMLGVSAPEKM